MSGPASKPQWYLARDGRQHGPISDAELSKFIEQGHLLPTDLIWREGFEEWRPAMAVFPPRAPAAPASPQHHPAAGGAPAAARRPGHRAAVARSTRGSPDDEEGGRRFPRGKAAAGLLLAAVLIGGGGAAYFYRPQLTGLFASLMAPSGAMAVADRKSLETPPLTGFRGGTAETIDTHLQATALWPVIKREFPDWYKERIGEAAALARDGKDDTAIGQHMATKLRELRRHQVANGLSATQPLLKTLAAQFFDNLVKLRAHSAEACHGLIDGGEANPTIVALLQGSKFTPGLQAQLTVMFEAIAEGRRQPRVHIRPSREEFEQLAKGLYEIGWTRADMVLFGDDKALAKAPPEKVCQLVHDFFKAQVEFPDPEARTKLLINALRPVFAG